MVQIVINAEQAKKLGDAAEAIEIVDESGNRLGFYTQPFSMAEVMEAKRRAESESGGRTTAEVLQRLLQLDSQ